VESKQINETPDYPVTFWNASASKGINATGRIQFMQRLHLLTVLLLICVLIAGGVTVHAQQEKKQSGSSHDPASTAAETNGEQTQTRESAHEQKQTQVQSKQQAHTQDPEQIQKQAQDRKREQLHENDDTPCFTTEDGNTYRWQHRFSRKLQKLEEQGQVEAMNKYLEKIASRYNFEYNGGADDFVHWAVQNRPWDTE
jgi:hypothetical protein